jgi:hypothetical protein
MMDAPQLRNEVRSLLLEFDRSFAASDAHARRHAFRLRFALARVEEQAQAAVMENGRETAFYTPERFDIALAILRAEIDRAYTFLRGTGVSAAAAATAAPIEAEHSQESVRRAA